MNFHEGLQEWGKGSKRLKGLEKGVGWFFEDGLVPGQSYVLQSNWRVGGASKKGC